MKNEKTASHRGFVGRLCAIGMSSIGGVGNGSTQCCTWRAGAYGYREAEAVLRDDYRLDGLVRKSRGVG